VKKLKVLIVDDSSVMRKIVERALRQAGLELTEVAEASNGAEALAEVAKGVSPPSRSSVSNRRPGMYMPQLMSETGNDPAAITGRR